MEEVDRLTEAPPQRLAAVARRFIRTETMAQAPEELLAGLLKEVSRSFYLTLRVLPGRIRTPIGLAYLLARTTDTIADTELVALEQRLEALRNLRERIQGQRADAAGFRRLGATAGFARRRRSAGEMRGEPGAAAQPAARRPATGARGARHHHQRAGTGLAPVRRRVSRGARGAAHGCGTG